MFDNFQVCITQRAERMCNCSLAAASRPMHKNMCTTLQFFTCFAPALFVDSGIDPEVRATAFWEPTDQSLAVANVQGAVQASLQVLAVHEAAELCALPY